MDKNKKVINLYGIRIKKPVKIYDISIYDLIDEAIEACNEHQEWNVLSIQYVEDARRVMVSYYTIKYED